MSMCHAHGRLHSRAEAAENGLPSRRSVDWCHELGESIVDQMPSSGVVENIGVCSNLISTW